MVTSTTAPGKTFASRSELAVHYKSDWHKYNLKRREAGLPLLEEADFTARWEAALALRKEKEAKAHNGLNHIKPGKTSKKKVKQKKNEEAAPKPETDPMETTEGPKGPKFAEGQENPDIDPKQSLFDSHISETLEENVEYMKQFGFFIPDQECLLDLEGLLGYCHEKIKLGHYCLYCEKMFPTWQGVQKHMIDKEHTKIRYEEGYWEEVDPFYDFTRADTKFVGEGGDGMDEDDGWEDIPEDGEQVDKEMYDGYEKEIARFGLDVTSLGELVFPDGRIVGHRALRRYYKQNFRPENTGTAIVAAKRAAGERLYEGRVVNIDQVQPSHELKGAGKGVLVKLKDGAEGFSALSLYRYRAVVRKQRRDNDKGQRQIYRTTLNMNRMDKKANRLMNGVSVAHAKR